MEASRALNRMVGILNFLVKLDTKLTVETKNGLLFFKQWLKKRGI
jgi:hypothetical protein